jgi:hypothetical protein
MIQPKNKEKEIQAMTNEIKNIFDTVINETTDKEVVAKLQIIKEYFSNDNFKKNLQSFSFAQTFKN